MISDLGVASFFKPTEDSPFCYHHCGTPSFIAPEILRGEGYTEKADIFSAGCLLYNLVTGKNIFEGMDLDEVLRANRECNLEKVFS